MENKRGEPKFKVGDVITGKETKAKGIVVDFEKEVEEKEVLEPADVVLEILEDIASGKTCAVTDFEESTLEVVSTSRVELCEGTQNKKQCIECEDFFKCPDSDFRLTCYTDGKLDKELCDKCKYRFRCWANR